MAAKPDLDDGYIQLAHELDAALAVADFTKGARIVLREVFAQIYGMAKRKTACISPCAIAEKVGVKREFIVRAIRELIDSNVLTKEADGTFRFVKDYESWTYKGASRLTVKEAKYCRLSAPKRGKTADRGGVDSAQESGTNQFQDLEPTGSNSWNQLVPDLEPTSSKTGTNEFQNEARPYRNAHAELKKEEKKNEDEKRTTKVSQAGLKLAFSEPESPVPPCPAIPDEDTSAYMIQTGGHRPDDATVQKLFRLAWSLFPGTEIANQYWSYQQWHSADVWAAALRKGKQAKPGLDRINYILTIAANYQTNGIPTPKPAQASSQVQPPRKRAQEIVVAPPDYEEHWNAIYGISNSA